MKSSSALIPSILLLILVCLMLVPNSPAVMPYAGRDSGVFLYTGWRILKGEIPYRDVWDHKPPMIYYVDALGLAAANGSRWGVWVIELLFLSCAALVGFRVMQRAWGSLPAWWGNALWIISLQHVLQGGNLTTEYTLPLQFACFGLALRMERRGIYGWDAFWTGVLTGLMFLTKQSTMGISTSILLYFALRHFRRRQRAALFKGGLVFLAGAGLVILGIAGYFWFHGALSQFWDAAFLYNFVYAAQSGPAAILTSMLKSFPYLSGTGLVQFALMGWISGILLLYLRPHKLGSEATALLGLSLINLPVEFLIVGATGHGHGHYFITLLPVSTALAGFIFWLIQAQLSSLGFPRLAQIAFGAATIGALLIAQMVEYWLVVKSYQKQNISALVNSVQCATPPEDSVLVWGAETWINFYTLRRSPTRFNYQTPLYDSNYGHAARVEQFLEDVLAHKPGLIITGAGDSLDKRPFPATSPRIEALFQYVLADYTYIATLDGWDVYTYTPQSSQPPPEKLACFSP